MASAVGHNINRICVQEHRYYHSKVELKYHDTGNGWTFLSESAQKNSINASIAGFGLLLSPLALKLLNSIERTQPRIMCATFNGNISTRIVSFYSSTNTRDETDVTTFYNELSSLVCHIPKQRYNHQ